MVAMESKLRHKRRVGVSGERKSSTWRRRGYPKVLWAEKRDISEERKVSAWAEHGQDAEG